MIKPAFFLIVFLAVSVASAASIYAQSGSSPPSSDVEKPLGVKVIILGLFLLIFLLRMGWQIHQRRETKKWIQAMEKLAKERNAGESLNPTSDAPFQIESEAEEPGPYPPAVKVEYRRQSLLEFQAMISSPQLASMQNVDLSGADLEDELIADCKLYIKYEPEEPEDSHILSCRIQLPDRHGNTWKATSLLHVDSFYAAFQGKGENNQFVSELSEEERSQLSARPALGPLEYMDDGRDYFEIFVSGLEIALKSKYLGMSFYLISEESPAVFPRVVVSNLFDCDAELIPDFICKLPDAKLLFENEARYDEDDEMWCAEESQPLKFERE